QWRRPFCKTVREPPRYGIFRAPAWRSKSASSKRALSAVLLHWSDDGSRTPFLWLNRVANRAIVASRNSPSASRPSMKHRHSSLPPWLCGLQSRSNRKDLAAPASDLGCLIASAVSSPHSTSASMLGAGRSAIRVTLSAPAPRSCSGVTTDLVPFLALVVTDEPAGRVVPFENDTGVKAARRIIALKPGLSHGPVIAAQQVRQVEQVGDGAQACLRTKTGFRSTQQDSPEYGRFNGHFRARQVRQEADAPQQHSEGFVAPGE